MKNTVDNSSAHSKKGSHFRQSSLRDALSPINVELFIVKHYILAPFLALVVLSAITSLLLMSDYYSVDSINQYFSSSSSYIWSYFMSMSHQSLFAIIEPLGGYFSYMFLAPAAILVLCAIIFLFAFIVGKSDRLFAFVVRKPTWEIDSSYDTYFKRPLNGLSENLIQFLPIVLALVGYFLLILLYVLLHFAYPSSVSMLVDDIFSSKFLQNLSFSIIFTIYLFYCSIIQLASLEEVYFKPYIVFIRKSLILIMIVNIILTLHYEIGLSHAIFITFVLLVYLLPSFHTCYACNVKILLLLIIGAINFQALNEVINSTATNAHIMTLQLITTPSDQSGTQYVSDANNLQLQVISSSVANNAIIFLIYTIITNTLYSLVKIGR